MAKVGIATFIQSAKGSVAVPVDLGGDTPKAIILIAVGHLTGNDGVAAGTNSLAARLGPDFNIGMAIAAADRVTSKINVNNASGTQVANRRDVARVHWTGTMFSQDWEVELTSFGADTVTLNFINAPISLGQDRRFTLIAFGGSDCEVHLNQQNMGTGTSAIDVTAPGFEPDVVFAMSSLVTTVGASANGGAWMSFGIGINDGADTQRCFARGEGATTLTVSRPAQAIYDNRIFSLINATVNPTTTGVGVVIGDYDASGYSLTPDASMSSWLLHCLAIKAPGIDFHLDDYLTPTATGVASYGGASFVPNRTFIVGGGATTINTPINWVEDAATHYFSLVEDHTDPAKVGIHALRNRNNVDPSQAANYSDDDGTVVLLGDTSFTQLEVGAFDTFTADGFDVDFTTVDSTSHIFFALMMGAAGSSDSPLEVNQSGVLIVANQAADVHVNYSGAVIVGTQEPGQDVTQSGALITAKVTQRPFNWVLPEIPITEQWDWRTDVITSDNGTEQRIAIRSTPRVSVTHKFALDNRPDLRRVFRAMWTELGKPIPVPHWQWRTKLTAVTATGDSRIYFDPAGTNLRDGGYAFIKEGDTFQIVRVKTVLADGARLSDTIGPVFTVAADIYPLTYNFARSGVALKRVAPDTWGEGEYNALDAATIGPIVNPYSDVVTLPTCDGLPILDRRPIGNSFEDAVETGAEQLDIGAGKNAHVDPWKRGDWVSQRTILLQRMRDSADVEWFRTFADYCKGSCFPFLMPSWRPDYDLVSAPGDGATSVTLTGDEYLTYMWPHAGFHYIAFEHADGIIVRKVTAAVASGANTALTLAEALPTPMPDVLKVSQVALSRVANDTMNLVHYPLYSTADFGIRTTDE